MSESHRPPQEKTDPAAMDPYVLLGVPRSATAAEIRTAFRALMKTLHPDVNKDPQAKEKSAMVSNAFTFLNDADKRRAYDAGRINIMGHQSKPPSPPRPEPPPFRYDPPPAPPPPPDPFAQWRKENEERVRRQGNWQQRFDERTEVLKSFNELRDAYSKKKEAMNRFYLFAKEGEGMAEKSAEIAEEVFATIVKALDDVDVYRVSNDPSVLSSVDSFMRWNRLDQQEFLRQLSGLHPFQTLAQILEMHTSFLACAPESAEARAFLAQTTATAERYIESALLQARLKGELKGAEGYLVRKATEPSPLQSVAERLLVKLRERKKQMWV